MQPGRTPRRPKLVVLDYGAMSEVEPHMIEGLIDVIGGIVEGEEQRLLKGFFAMGFVSKEGNRELLRKTVRHYFEKLLRIKNRTPAALMNANQRELESLVDPQMARDELRELMKSMEYPEGWFYVERASVMAFWLLGQIDPEVDAMQVGYPYVMPLLRGKVDFSKAEQTAAQTTEQTAEQTANGTAVAPEPSTASAAPVEYKLEAGARI